MDLQFDSFAEFFAMGGHGLYVWLAYAATLLVFLGSFFVLRSAQKRQMQRLQWSVAVESEQLESNQSERDQDESET